jgi:radical SAM superfamily enzyme YgiQ (UPF0313 family)
MSGPSFHVTLVRPPAISTADSMNISSLTPSLALAYLSAALRQAGFGVTNVDAIGEGLGKAYRLQRNPLMEAQGLSPREVIERIPRDTDLIGVSCMFSTEWPATRDLINAIREAFPEKPIVIGGEHATALPELSMSECPVVDYLILGEGDRILLELARALQEKSPLHGIAGLLYRQDGKAVRATPPVGERSFDGASGSRVKNLDELPWPAWDITPLEPYLDAKLTFGRYVGKTMPIVGSRGCPHECTFCSNPMMWGRRYTTRSPKDVVKEILHYKAKYGIEAVEFYDLTPIVRKQWIVEFSEEMIRTNAGIRWQISGGTRCEGIDEEVIVKAKQAGCGYLGFAPESGVQEVLDRIKKRLKLSHMLKLIKIAHQHRVDTRCNLIIGFPEDTRSQIWRTLLFQIRLAFLGVVDAPVFEFTPYPGSALFEKLRAEGVIDRLDDTYFESLGFNIQGTKARRRYCKAVGPAELMFYRTIGMSLFYGIYYLIRPKKLWSLAKNLTSFNNSNSVFEQRLIQHVRRVRARKVIKPETRWYVRAPIPGRETPAFEPQMDSYPPVPASSPHPDRGQGQDASLM